MMKKARRRFKQTTTFRCRVEAFAEDMREQAQETPGPHAREQLLRRARKADTAIDVDQWITGNKQRPELMEAMLDQISPRAHSTAAQRTEDV
jgi:hypothetical protein